MNLLGKKVIIPFHDVDTNGKIVGLIDDVCVIKTDENEHILQNLKETFVSVEKPKKIRQFQQKFSSKKKFHLDKEIKLGELIYDAELSFEAGKIFAWNEISCTYELENGQLQSGQWIHMTWALQDDEYDFKGFESCPLDKIDELESKIEKYSYQVASLIRKLRDLNLDEKQFSCLPIWIKDLIEKDKKKATVPMRERKKREHVRISGESRREKESIL